MKQEFTNSHPDALDELIANELTKQAQLRSLMQSWEQRRRQQRRLRLAPVISNILSVAALMVLGFFLQAMLPQARLADSSPATKLVPVIEQWVEPDTAQTMPSSDLGH